MYVAIQSLRKE